MTARAEDTPRKVADVRRETSAHWVGDGFPVRTLFSYGEQPERWSPFLLLDYASPRTFPPAAAGERRGVGAHPHRGFETVTIVYGGEVEHRDSAGGGGRIGFGDVQWMTAGSGLVHEEFHGREYAKTGGTFEMAQLWVNLPKAHKLTAPRYQAIAAAEIPVVALGGGATVRVIAGNLAGASGPARTFSPVHVGDLRLPAGSRVRLAVADGDTALIAALRGTLRIGGAEVAPGSLVVFEREGTAIELEAAGDATALLLAGTPIDEPVVGHGPFVMNSPQEIRQAILDFQSGRMGELS